MTALVRGGRPDLKCLGLVPFLLLPTGEPKLEAAVGKAVVNGIIPLQSNQGQAVPRCPLERKDIGVVQDP